MYANRVIVLNGNSHVAFWNQPYDHLFAFTKRVLIFTYMNIVHTCMYNSVFKMYFEPIVSRQRDSLWLVACVVTSLICNYTCFEAYECMDQREFKVQ